MAKLLDNSTLQYYSNKILKAENRKHGNKPLSTVLNEIDSKIESMKTLFDTEYGEPLNVKLENDSTTFSIGTGNGVDKSNEVENGFTELAIKGETLLNVVDNYLESSFYYRESSMYADTTFNLKMGDSVNSSSVRPQKGLHLYKPGAHYTVIVDIISNSTDTFLGISNINTPIVGWTDRDFSNKLGISHTTIRIGTDLDIDSKGHIVNSSLYFGFWGASGGDLSKSINFRYWVIPGDYSNKPLPNFFRGMSSIGQVESKGLAAIGNNLFDISQYPTNWSYSDSSGVFTRFGNGFKGIKTNDSVLEAVCILEKLIPCKKNTYYTLSYTSPTPNTEIFIHFNISGYTLPSCRGNSHILTVYSGDNEIIRLRIDVNENSSSLNESIYSDIKLYENVGEPLYSIFIDSYNSNILDESSMLEGDTIGTYFNGEFKNGKIRLTGMLDNRTVAIIPVRMTNGKSYKFTHHNTTNPNLLGSSVQVYSSVNGVINMGNQVGFVWDKEYEWTLPTGLYFARYYTNYQEGVVEFNAKIEVGKGMLPYEPYESERVKVLLGEPLRSVPDKVSDSIEKINGEYKVVRRCGEVTLKASDITEMYKMPNDHRANISTESFVGMKTSHWESKLAPEAFFQKVFHKQYVKEIDTYWYWFHSIKGVFYIRVPSGTTLDQVRQSLVGSKVIYMLEKPIIEDINPVTLRTWKNGSVTIDDVIPTKTTHSVDLNKSAQIQSTIDELTNLKNRVTGLENQYDRIALEQSHKLSLLNHSINLDLE